MDTIDAIGVGIDQYATAHDPSKVDLRLSPQSQYNFNPFNEDDNRSTSGESTQSNEEECQDDYETPISAPDSRRESQEYMRRSPEDIERAQPKPFTGISNEDLVAASEPSIPQTQKQTTHTPMNSIIRSPPALPSYMPDSTDLSIFHNFKGPAPISLLPEATEDLPPYTANIELSNVFLRKFEFHTLNTRCHDRKWRRVIASLTGTKLEFYAATRTFYFHLPSRTDLPCNVKKGALLKSYSLQHAEVGLATDYLKRKFVIRVRVEAEQFLLSCTEIETLVEWMEKLQWGSGMALELDEREEVKEQTLPRNLRRTRRTAAAGSTASAVAAERDEDSGAAGEERLRQQRPHSSSLENLNVEEETAPDPEPTAMAGANHIYTPTAFSSITSSPNISRTPTPAPSQMDGEARLAPNYHARAQSNTNIIFRSMPRPSVGRPHTSGGRDGLALYPSTLSQSITNLAVPSASPSTSGTLNHSSPNLSRKSKKKKDQKAEDPEQEEKQVWRPRSKWSANYDLAYAKKCMPALLQDAKRKSCWVFFNGERHVVKMGNMKGKDGKRQVVMERLERLIPKQEAEDEPPTYEAMIKA